MRLDYVLKKNMIKIAIRCLPRDDYIARLCYESWKLAGLQDAEFHLLAEPGDYPFASVIPNKVIQTWCSGWGGELGINAVLGMIKSVPIQSDDFLIMSDADIVAFANPMFDFAADFDIAGVANEFFRQWGQISGQCIVMKGHIARALQALDGNATKEHIQWLQAQGAPVCDDVFIGSYAFRQNAKMLGLPYRVPYLATPWWKHYKHYFHAPRMDFEKLVREIKESVNPDVTPNQP